MPPKSWATTSGLWLTSAELELAATGLDVAEFVVVLEGIGVETIGAGAGELDATGATSLLEASLLIGEARSAAGSLEKGSYNEDGNRDCTGNPKRLTPNRLAPNRVVGDEKLLDPKKGLKYRP